MQSNRLQINSHKTGLLWYATTRRQYQLPRSPLLVDGTPINPVQSVRDLGIFIDADLVMRTHVHKTVSRCLAILRQLHSIRHLVPATINVPDSYRLVGTVEAGLQKRRLGLSSCLSVPASSVSDERGSTAHLRPASLRQHLRRTHHPPLAPGSGEDTVQDGRAHVQGHSWNCAVISESTGSYRRSAWSTFPPLC